MIKEVTFEQLKSPVKVSDNQDIAKLERAILEQPQVPCPVIHSFGPGVYMRQLSLPAGNIAIGQHQNFEHVSIFIKGRMTFFNEDGTRKEVQAPMTFISPPGQKIAYVHEDSVFMNVYSTNETDVEKLEDFYLTKKESFLEHKEKMDSTPLLTSKFDHNDFELFLIEFGLTKEQVRELSETESDMIPLPHGSYKFKKGKSKIEGTGLFATADIEPFEILCAARIDGKRTIAGRFTNHSANPNAKMIKGSNGDIALMATKKILGCHGGQDGEEITIDYRQSLRLNLDIAKEGQKCLHS